MIVGVVGGGGMLLVGEEEHHKRKENNKKIDKNTLLPLDFSAVWEKEEQIVHIPQSGTKKNLLNVGRQPAIYLLYRQEEIQNENGHRHLFRKLKI